MKKNYICLAILFLISAVFLVECIKTTEANYLSNSRRVDLTYSVPLQPQCSAVCPPDFPFKFADLCEVQGNECTGHIACLRNPYDPFITPLIVSCKWAPRHDVRCN
jgi:hypothetical protein